MSQLADIPPEEIERRLRNIIAECDKQIETWMQVLAMCFESEPKVAEQKPANSHVDPKTQRLMDTIRGLKDLHRVDMFTWNIRAPELVKMRLITEFPFLAETPTDQE